MDKEVWIDNIKGYMDYVSSRSSDSYMELLKVLNARLVDKDGKTGIGFSFGENTQQEDIVVSPDGFTEDDLATVQAVIAELIVEMSK